MARFLDELYLIGALTDDHDTEYDGTTYITPSILRGDGKENPRIGDHANPLTQA